jgi:hypothetical protein
VSPAIDRTLVMYFDEVAAGETNSGAINDDGAYDVL